MIGVLSTFLLSFGIERFRGIRRFRLDGARWLWVIVQASLALLLLVGPAATATKSAKEAEAEAAAEAAIQGNLGHPYNLPVASRAKMHACGVEWQKMKLSGEAAEKTWRFFASQCLVQPD